MNRSDIQEQINSILKNNPKATLEDIKSQISDWIDQTDLSQPLAQDKVALADSVTTAETGTSLSHDFMKQHILDDLNSYAGVGEMPVLIDPAVQPVIEPSIQPVEEVIK